MVDDTSKKEAKGLEEYISPDIWDSLSFDDENYNTSLMVEHLCLHCFPVVQIFNEKFYSEAPPPDFPGKLLNSYKAGTHLIIYEYEYCIMIGVGEMAFAEYGNYGRMIKTIYEVFNSLLPRVMEKNNWERVTFLATHERYESIAWAIARATGVPVVATSPNEYAAELFVRLSTQEPGKSWLQPSPG